VLEHERLEVQDQVFEVVSSAFWQLEDIAAGALRILPEVQQGRMNTLRDHLRTVCLDYRR
jgi:hypothetical protein